MASRQLELVIRLAREREEQAARELGGAQNQRAGAADQLQQLMDYQADYRRRARGEQGNALSASQLVEARRFLSEINGIVEAQLQQLQQLDALVAQQQQIWADASRYTRAIEKLAADRHAAQQLEIQKREQQQLDDFYSQQQFYRL